MTTQERTLDPAVLEKWVGRQERASDVFLVGSARRMQATLDLEPSLQEGDPLPALWHWNYYLNETPQSGLGRDGHPKLGGFLPPVALPRRMWAGGRLTFEAPLPLGATVDKLSTVTGVKLKEGRTGPLCFVTVRHEYSIAGAACMTEEHDIVYREDPDPAAPKPDPAPAPDGATVRESVTPSETMLFRYSALTFNGHRIHYDRSYCREVEGYPGLVFHGPLTGTLLADLAVRSNPGKTLKRFAFRALSPLFDTAAFTIAGKASENGMSLWAETPGGGLAMSAEAEFG